MSSNNTTKLEVENKQMENRLRILKEMMSAEKARRESAGGIHWESGKSGPLQHVQVAPPAASKAVARNLTHKKPVKVRILTDKNVRRQSSDPKPSMPRCGQCEKTTALLNCIECIENYCQLCFAKMHQKGGLAKHHVKPILQKNLVKNSSPKEVDSVVKSSSSPPPKEASNSQQAPASLLEGTYNEAESTKSFQEALAEWRGESSAKGSNTTVIKDSSDATKSEIATMTATAGASTKPVNVEFSDGSRTTYFERLLMRKFRESPVVLSSPSAGPATEEVLSKSPEKGDSKEEEDALELEHTISQYNVFYDAKPKKLERSEVEPDPFDGFNYCSAPSVSRTDGQSNLAIKSATENTSKPALEDFKERTTENSTAVDSSSEPTEQEKDQSTEPVIEKQVTQIIQDSDQPTKSSAESSFKATADPSALNSTKPAAKSSSTPPADHSTKLAAAERVIEPVIPHSGEPTTKKTPSATEKLGVEVHRSDISTTHPSEVEKGKKLAHKSKKGKDPMPAKPEPDLSASVKAAWDTCTGSEHDYQQMSYFFLQSVQSAESQPEPSKPLTTETEQPQGLSSSTFKLGSAVWLPTSSVQSAEPRIATSTDIPSNDTPPLPLDDEIQPLPQESTDDNDHDEIPTPPLEPRPSTRDRYYDDDSDSDSSTAEDERTAFISSRLGMVQDSIHPVEPRPGSSYRELEEDEEKMERDKADCECLDDLACELASTVECEGRLTRCEDELDQSDPEETGGDEIEGSVTPVPGQLAAEEGELDMTKVISEFELYQKELMEQDIDEQ